MAEFSGQKDAPEKELSRKSDEFRKEKASLLLNPAELQQILPEHVALVDWF